MAKKGIEPGRELDLSAYPGITQVAGGVNAAGLQFVLVVSRFNTELTGSLVKEVLDTLVSAGAAASDITLIRVPGAYEIPAAVEELLSVTRPDAVICLGCIIRGETPHADMINSYVTGAIGDLSRAHGVPVIDGIVATHNIEQAVERCMPGEGCRGPYLARAAVEMVDVFRQINEMHNTED
ncbi:MAG: 6,7-dimethyl-8-ribityllumazine synthase [Verrucomicrobia bacterium]|nr:6,7-dimethyl-8-ribityllumazine synthase [Verrucomicrobiota bacterium]